MKTRTAVAAATLASVLLTSPCDGGSYHAEMIDALDEWPGACSYSVRSDEPPCRVESIEVLQSQEIAGGVVLIYRAPLETEGLHLLARTFLTPKSGLSGGWQPQSSCHVVFGDRADFVARWCPGGNVTSLTTVYGLAERGNSVRVEWSDGRVDTVPVLNRSFAQSRPSHKGAERVELLSITGAVLLSEELNYDQAGVVGSVARRSRGQGDY